MDLFTLNGFVRLTLEGCDEPVDLLPPVIEESIERDGTLHFIVNDGMHRVVHGTPRMDDPSGCSSQRHPQELAVLRVPSPVDGDQLRNGTICRRDFSRSGTGFEIIMHSIATLIRLSAM